MGNNCFLIMKASKTLTLIVLLSFVMFVQAGLWEDLTDYIWNWNVYQGAMGSIIGCWQCASGDFSGMMMMDSTLESASRCTAAPRLTSHPPRWTTKSPVSSMTEQSQKRNDI